MSLFNRKPKENKNKRNDNFSIYQFVKIEGLKTNKKEKFVPTEFVSPIFGLSVKDETVAPYVNVDTGDKVKQYDFLRTNPKGDLSKYDEFKTTILTAESRKEIFGDDVYIDSKRKYEDPRLKKEELVPLYTGKEETETFVDMFDNYEQEPSDQIKIKSPMFEEPPISEPLSEQEPKRFTKPVEREIPVPRPRPPRPDFLKPETHTETTQPEITQEQEPKETPRRRFFQSKARSEYRFPTVDMFYKVERDQHSKPNWLIEQEESINRTLITNVLKVKNIVMGQWQ